MNSTYSTNGQRTMRRNASRANRSFESRPAVYTDEASTRTSRSRTRPARAHTSRGRSSQAHKAQGRQTEARLPKFSLPTFNLPKPNISWKAVDALPTPLVIVVLVALATVLLVGPVRGYYKAWRDSGILRAEYEVLKEQNHLLNDDISRLITTEGIEDEARSRGYVYPDEEALVINNIEEADLTDPSLVEEAIEEHERTLPWYVRMLDVVLGYSRE